MVEALEPARVALVAQELPPVAQHLQCHLALLSTAASVPERKLGAISMCVRLCADMETWQALPLRLCSSKEYLLLSREGGTYICVLMYGHVPSVRMQLKF